MESDDAIVILLGAGAGRRLGAAEPKALLPIGGRPMLAVAAAAAAASAPVRGLVVTFPQGWEGRARACVEDLGVPVLLVVGGGSRQASVRAALAEVPGTVESSRCTTPPGLSRHPTCSRRSCTRWRRVRMELSRCWRSPIPCSASGKRSSRAWSHETSWRSARPHRLSGRRSCERHTRRRRQRAPRSPTTPRCSVGRASMFARSRATPTTSKITTLADLAQADRRMGGDDA